MPLLAEMNAPLGPLIGTTLFALVFLLVGRLEGGSARGRRNFLASSAGVAIAYVFVDIMPHLASKQRVLLAAGEGGVTGFAEHHAYLVSLLGFLIYFVSSLAPGSSPGTRLPDSRNRRARWTRGGVVGSACAYVCLISYMLTEQPDHRAEPIAFFALAMSIHMCGVAHFVRVRLGDAYDGVHRYTIAGGAYLGWLMGALTRIPETTYALWFSFLAGGIFGIVVTVELRNVDDFGTFRRFVLGAGTLTALLLLLEFFSKLD
jgi:hypothetical protein